MRVTTNGNLWMFSRAERRFLGKRREMVRSFFMEAMKRLFRGVTENIRRGYDEGFRRFRQEVVVAE